MTFFDPYEEAFSIEAKPVVAELASNPARSRRREAKASRADQSAVYVPYRRRTATGAVRVAPALVPAWRSWHSERRLDA